MKSPPSPTAVASPIAFDVLQDPSVPPLELLSPPATRYQKRKNESEDEHLQKKPRKDLPSTLLRDEHFLLGRPAFPPEHQLSKANLRRLERETSSSDMTDQGRKRTPSRQTSNSDLSQEITVSTKSQMSNSLYRFKVLEGAKIFVYPEPPPENIQSQVDAVTKRTISDAKRHVISGITKKMSHEFIKKLRGSHREDDLVELVYEAFQEIYPGEVFNCPSLKPKFQQSIWSTNAFAQLHETDDIVDRPSKRQQADRPLPSPDVSQSSMPPPPLPPSAPSTVPLSRYRQDNAIKTPRPEFTIGFYHSTLVGALMKRGLSEFKADGFLKFLQEEDQLYSDPTQDFVNVRFPILVIEGKAYATGKTVFEAENQAAVSGSCMVNLQRQLSKLFGGVFPNSERSLNTTGGKSPLAFSICTQGPIIELWVHHFVLVEEGISMHYMNLLKVCYGSLADGLEEFLLLLERLMCWYKDDFLEEVADQLFDLADHTARV